MPAKFIVNPKLGKSLNNIKTLESLEHVDIEGLVNKVHIKGKKLSKFKTLGHVVESDSLQQINQSMS